MPKNHATSPKHLRLKREGLRRFEKNLAVRKRQPRKKMLTLPAIPAKLEKLGFRKKVFFNTIQNCGILAEGNKIKGVKKFLEKIEFEKEAGRITNIELLLLKYSLDNAVWRFYNRFGKKIHAIDFTTYKAIKRVLQDYGFSLEEIAYFRTLFSDYFWEKFLGNHPIQYSK